MLQRKDNFLPPYPHKARGLQRTMKAASWGKEHQVGKLRYIGKTVESI